MKRLLLPLIFAGSITAQAGDFSKSTDEPVSQPASNLKFGYELDAKYAGVGGSSTESGEGRRGDVSEQEAMGRVVLTPQWGQGPLYRFGLGYQRYSFGLPGRAVLPNTLQATNLIVGADFAVGDAWLVRIEAQPGIYSDFRDLSSSDWNVPFQIGATYIAGESLQFVAAIAVNLDHQYPVIPVVGLRWVIGGPWTLNAILPNPRLEYTVRKGLLLFAGAEVQSATYRLSEDFGDGHEGRRQKLNGAIVEYDELRVGAGFSWKPAAGVTVEGSAGYQPYRDFNYHRAGVNYETKAGAAYGEVAVSARF